MNKKLAPLRVKNDVTHANCMNEWTKSRSEVVVTSYGRNKNHDEINKNQEKANNSLSYRFAAIKERLIRGGSSECCIEWARIEVEWGGLGVVGKTTKPPSNHDFTSSQSFRYLKTKTFKPVRELRIAHRLNALRILHVYPNVEDKKSNGKPKKLSDEIW